MINKELGKAAHAVGGSFKTRDARIMHVRMFSSFLKAKNIRIEKIAHIKAKHIRAFVQARLGDGIQPRTLQNELASLRGVLRHVGRDKLSDLPELSNKMLGLGGASRAGKKTALKPERATQLTEGVADIGVRACISLEQALGLRREEAVKSFKSLHSWQRQLLAGRPVRVIYGTKGGRPRFVHPFNVERALIAVTEAIKVVKAYGVLINKKDEKSAMRLYSRQMHKAGFRGFESGHALRYQFAHDQFAGYLQQGLTRGEALAATSLDLGHGDGRGNYVKRVYLL